MERADARPEKLAERFRRMDRECADERLSFTRAGIDHPFESCPAWRLHCVAPPADQPPGVSPVIASFRALSVRMQPAGAAACLF